MKKEDCIFCKVASGLAQSWKVLENDSVYAFLDINPVNEYHTLVIPKEHYENIFDIPTDVLKEIVSVIKEITSIYNRKLGIENVQIVNSSGVEAQQDVFHFHMHIVPRYNGDDQDIKWKTHKEWRVKFDELLESIK